MNNPLVSIVVYTYNSSETIIDTLESIKIQTYPNIELIVSDDGSKDDTYIKALTWVNINREKFCRALVIRSFSNMGTSFNYNHGIINSTGYYIKILDGDDCLCGKDSINKFVEFLQSNNHDIVMSDVELFSEDDVDVVSQRAWYDEIFEKTNEPLDKQQKRIPVELRIADPGIFFKRSLYNEIGGFDEKYKLMEEWPFFYNVIMKGHKIDAIPERLVKYRLRDNSVSHGKLSKTFVVLLNDWNRFFIKVRMLEMIRRHEYKQVVLQSYRNFMNYIRTISKYYINRLPL